MECTEVQLILSGAHDGDPDDLARLDVATAHCAECEKCASFREALDALERMPRPRAPEDLVGAVMDRVALEETPAAAEEAPQPSALPLSRRSKGWWLAPALAIGTAAAVFVAGVFITVRAMTASLDTASETALSERMAESPAPAETAPSDGAAVTGSLDAEEPGLGATQTVTGIAPDYVAFDDVVYVVGETAEADLAELTELGTVSSALDRLGAPTTYSVYEVPTGADVVLMETETEGEFATLTPVTRVYEGRTYALVPGAALQRFGEWPTLPAAVPRPTRDDGTPVFALDGTDALNVNVYVRLGGSAEAGIAIAPRTPLTDPAAGNPDWTWWEILED